MKKDYQFHVKLKGLIHYPSFESVGPWLKGRKPEYAHLAASEWYLKKIIEK